MAFYTSYQNTVPAEKEKRMPLSVINGNRKPLLVKESLQIADVPSTSEQNNAEVCNSFLPFPIFSDNENYEPKVGEKKFVKLAQNRHPTYTEEEYDCFNRNILFSPLPPKYCVKQDNKENEYLEFGHPYKVENFAHLRTTELKYRPRLNYIKLQQEITSQMRAILIDWLVEVGLQFEFSSEAIHLAVSIIDRFLSCSMVSKSKLQLVGIASLFITAKYEEVVPQELNMYAWITDSTYTKKQILKMEQLIMHRLDFYVGGPTALSFAHLAYSMVETPKKVLHLAQYICELALLDIDPFISFLPSQIGVSAYCLSRYTLGYPMWTPELVDTGYCLDNLKCVIGHLFNKVRSISSQPLTSIIHKYSLPDFSKIAEVEMHDVLIMCD